MFICIKHISITFYVQCDCVSVKCVVYIFLHICVDMSMYIWLFGIFLCLCEFFKIKCVCLFAYSKCKVPNEGIGVWNIIIDLWEQYWWLTYSFSGLSTAPHGLLQWMDRWKGLCVIWWVCVTQQYVMVTTDWYLYEQFSVTCEWRWVRQWNTPVCKWSVQISVMWRDTHMVLF